ncbi:hypothetical protein ABB37_09396 [Leptomonas pyrrhocoris]|uniref:Uncharacterized protein n=1 Tax=Leptomonas pyrrhocoris TaxID=157538 RepID=A0A0N0VD25_LEPPY|nr:hypothetical protein ABB37_09396 [Leptomonas pyrrhocoris]KPA74108.1 hypothetical protein ABB37_09396 [Leptomonas pyrrhocoris]|eukprot:XP_015652547.1 hypothetical protein ABB37_09396 [Leptomonas pyrrhocoris]
MMGYEGRSLLLSDGEEWVNIPFVVREFMRQLNDEVQASRTVVESMRQEQKEVNLLLRRVIQKQADLEMDNTRNTLSLNRATHTTQDERHKRHSEQIHYLRKKQEKLDEKVQQLTASASTASQMEAALTIGPGNAELADKVSVLSGKVENCDKELRERMRSSRDAQRSAENLLSSSIAAAASEMEKTLNERLSDFDVRMVAAEKVAEVHQEILEAQKQESKELRSLCGDLADMVEKDRQVNKERLAACFQMVEKGETLCTAQRVGVEADMNRLESAMKANVERMRGDAKSSYMEMRDLVKGEQHVVILRCNELAEELLRVKEQQKLLQDQLMSNETDSATVRALKLTKELSGRITDLEAQAEQHASDYVPRREFQKIQRETQNALDALIASYEETKAALHSQIQQLGKSVRTVQAEHGEDNDWLHNELGRLGTVVSYGTQQREKQERQVTSLCDIVHNLSVAVGVCQTDLAKSILSTSEAKASAAPATSASHATAAVTTTTTETTNGEVRLPPSWEAWRLHITNEVETKFSTTSTLQQRCERLSHQLNELTAKVDGGARYAQSIASQHLDQVRQSVRDEVSQQLQAHGALREITPALAEIEAVKRRVAGLELEVQSAAARTERWRTEDAGGLSDGGPGGVSSDLLRRLVFAESSVDDFKHRLLELKEHVMEFEQHRNSVTRTMHQLETRLYDQERVVTKLGTDLTTALESLLRTEESLSQHKGTLAAQMTEVRTLPDRWREEMTAFAQANANAATPNTAFNAVTNKADHLQAEVNKLFSLVEQTSAEMNHNLAQQMGSVRAELDTLHHDCTAEISRCCDGTARCTKAATEAAARERKESEIVYNELRRRFSDQDNEVRALSERLSAVETGAAAHGSTPHDAPVATPESATATTAATTLSPPQESEVALERCTEELRACHRRLDAQQQRIGTLADEVLNAVTEQDEAARRGWQVKVDTLRDEVMAWVTAYVAAQIKKYRGEMRALAEDAARTASSNLGQVSMPAEKPTRGDDEISTAELRKHIDSVQRNLEHRLDGTLSAQRRELDDVARRVESVHMAHAELRREVRDDLATQQEDHAAIVRELRDALDDVKESNAAASSTVPPLPSSAPSPLAGGRNSPSAQLNETAERETARKWKDDVLQRVHAEFYSKSLLEERLENIWSSMVSLLARKEDMAAVNEKLSGLHRLMQEELQIEMEKLEEQLAGQLAEKVNLTSLQDILEDHFMDPQSAAS